MRGVCWIFCLLLLLASDAAAQSSQPATQPATQPVTRFTAIDIFVDPQGQPLGAYQIEFRAIGGDVKLVGVEGGAAEPFKRPPHYDAKALQQSRIMIAAFSTDSSLPTTKTRVARLHLQVRGVDAPDYELKLIIAGDRDAKPIPAAASYAPHQEQ